MVPSDRRRPESGQVLILMAMMALILVAFVGLVIDGGQLTAQTRASQSAADGASLAAAYVILHNGYVLADATALGKAVAAENNIPSADITLTYYATDGSVTTDPTLVTAVQSDVVHAFPTLFLPIIDITKATIKTKAKVTVTTTGNGCGFCVLGATGTTFTFASPANNFMVTGGSLAIASNSAAALSDTSGGLLKVNGSILAMVCGIYNPTGQPIQPTPTIVASVADPLAGITLPTNVPVNRGSPGFQTVYQPGLYTNWTIPPSGLDTQLAAGVYIVTGSFTDNADGNVTTPGGVMIYLACASYPTPCTPGQAGASFTDNSAAGISLHGLTTAPYQGMAVFADPNNSSAINIHTADSIDMVGTFYAPNMSMYITGSSGGSGANARIIVKSFSDNATGAIHFSYDPAQNYTGTGTSGKGLVLST